MSTLLELRELFHTMSLEKKDVRCLERLCIGDREGKQERVKPDEFWDRCIVHKEEVFAALRLLWATVWKVQV